MKNYKTLLAKNGINTPLRLAHFYAQIEHESGLIPQSENLNYSAKTLLKVFPRYFTPQRAKEYEFKPVEIANLVYGGRMGNNTFGDGWKYRGRGFMQITGKQNYKSLSIDTGTDYITNPDLLLNESDAMVSAVWYWNNANLNKFADLDDLDSISDLINIGRRTTDRGDANGYEHRLRLLYKWKKHFKV